MLLVQLIIIQIITFIGLIFVLRKLMYSASFKESSRLEKLSQEYTKRLQDLEQKYSQVQEDCNQIQAQAKREAQKILLEAKIEGEKTKKEYKDKAQEQKEQILKQAQAAKDALKNQIEANINERCVGYAASLLKDVLTHNIEEKMHDNYLQEIITSLRKMADKDFIIDQNTSTIKLTTAYKLSGHQLGEIQEVLNNLAKRELVLQEEVDKNLAAGIMLHWDNFFLDASILGKIKKAADGLYQREVSK